jgi:hypothetical protein
MGDIYEHFVFWNTIKQILFHSYIWEFVIMDQFYNL